MSHRSVITGRIIVMVVSVITLALALTTQILITIRQGIKHILKHDKKPFKWDHDKE